METQSGLRNPTHAGSIAESRGEIPSLKSWANQVASHRSTQAKLALEPRYFRNPFQRITPIPSLGAESTRGGSRGLGCTGRDDGTKEMADAGATRPTISSGEGARTNSRRFGRVQRSPPCGGVAIAGEGHRFRTTTLARPGEGEERMQMAHASNVHRDVESATDVIVWRSPRLEGRPALPIRGGSRSSSSR